MEEEDTDLSDNPPIIELKIKQEEVLSLNEEIQIKQEELDLDPGMYRHFNEVHF